MNRDSTVRAVNAYLPVLDGPDASRLRFFEGLWDLQATFDSQAASYEPIGPRAAREALLSGRSLFTVNPPEVSLHAYLEALARVVSYTVEMAGLPAEHARDLARADIAACITAERLAIAPAAPGEFVEAVAAALGLAGDSSPSISTLAFVLVSALTPFLESPAALGMAELDVDGREAARMPRCPICGSPATLALVAEAAGASGVGRFLWCGVCRTEWPYERIRCARCGTRSQTSLRYVHVEGDEAHRIHVCDECHGYVRTIFQEAMDRPISLPVEDVVTAGLDAVACSMITPSAQEQCSDRHMDDPF